MMRHSIFLNVIIYIWGLRYESNSWTMLAVFLFFCVLCFNGLFFFVKYFFIGFSFLYFIYCFVNKNEINSLWKQHIINFNQFFKNTAIKNVFDYSFVDNLANLFIFSIKIFLYLYFLFEKIIANNHEILSSEVNAGIHFVFSFVFLFFWSFWTGVSYFIAVMFLTLLRVFFVDLFYNSRTFRKSIINIVGLPVKEFNSLFTFYLGEFLE